MNPSRRQGLSEGGPEGIQLFGVAPFTTCTGVNAAVPLRKVHEQFRAFIDADHDGHGDRRVLAESVGFGQEQLFELLDGRIGLHARGCGRSSEDRPAGVVGKPIRSFISGPPWPGVVGGLRRSWRLVVGLLPIWAVCIIPVGQSFHLERRSAVVVPHRDRKDSKTEGERQNPWNSALRTEQDAGRQCRNCGAERPAPAVLS